MVLVIVLFTCSPQNKKESCLNQCCSNFKVKGIISSESARNVRKIKFFICSTNAHNSYKIVKLLKPFKIIIVAPTCFSSHKPSSGSSQPVLHQSYNVDISYILLPEVIGSVAAYFVQSCYTCGSCTVHDPHNGLCEPKHVGELLSFQMILTV